MTGIWHDRDSEGNVIAEVEFTSAQCAVDKAILQKFEGLEINVSRGIVNDATTVPGVLAMLKDVPKRRADHWRRELARIGAIPAQKSEEKPAEDEKVASRAADLTGRQADKQTESKK
jgi:hypothetical protein